MTKSNRRYLVWWDILILTLILFGEAIYSSNLVFFQSAGAGDGSLVEVTAAQNYYMLLVQGITLLVAFGYLWLRKFDFSQWQFKASLKQTGLGLGLFVLLAGLMEVLYLMAEPGYMTYFQQAQFDPQSGFYAFLSAFSLPAVLYALLNGVYEEIYFLGMCLAVKKEWRVVSWLFSILVRIAFHTYQGLLPALGIGVILGLVYYVWYDRLGKRNLYPIFLSHAIADVIGLNLLIYLFV